MERTFWTWGGNYPLQGPGQLECAVCITICSVNICYFKQNGFKVDMTFWHVVPSVRGSLLINPRKEFCTFTVEKFGSTFVSRILVSVFL